LTWLVSGIIISGYTLTFFGNHTGCLKNGTHLHGRQFGNMDIAADLNNAGF